MNKENGIFILVLGLLISQALAVEDGRRSYRRESPTVPEVLGEETGGNNLRKLRYESVSVTDMFKVTEKERFSNIRITSEITCGNQTASIKNHISRGYDNMVTLRKIIAFYRKKPDIMGNKEHMKNLANIEKVAACIQGKMTKIAVDCSSKVLQKTCKDDVNAFTQPQIQFNRIYLCPRYFNNGKIYQAAVVVHEVSHLCGTDDIHYLESWQKPKQYGTYFNPLYLLGNKEYPGIKIGRASHLNGDAYEYWVRKGFCLPGYDCTYKY